MAHRSYVVQNVEESTCSASMDGECGCSRSFLSVSMNLGIASPSLTKQLLNDAVNAVSVIPHTFLLLQTSI